MKFEIILGDITKMEVDAIVNAANSSLQGGGGVDGAIHLAGGQDILRECKQIGGCAPGQAVVTTAGKIPSGAVIHTVGPKWRGGNQNEAETLAECYQNTLELAREKGFKTLAFPSISTGIYGYPKEQAGDIAIRTVKEYVEKHPDAFDSITFVCFDLENLVIYSKLLG